MKIVVEFFALSVLMLYVMLLIASGIAHERNPWWIHIAGIVSFVSLMLI